jgi:energy-coupling factor transport system ATP-binding protein
LENIDILSRFHLELPDYLQVVYALKARGKRTNRDISNLDEAGLELIQIISSQKGN